MSAKKKYRSADEYLQYLKGDGPGRERHDFERGMETDPFEKEALEGLGQLTAKEAEEDILALHGRLRKRLVRRRRYTLYSIAATVASLLIVGTVFLRVYDFNPAPTGESVTPQEMEEIQHEDSQGAIEMAEAPVEEVAAPVEEVAAPVEEKEIPLSTEQEKKAQEIPDKLEKSIEIHVADEEIAIRADEAMVENNAGAGTRSEEIVAVEAEPVLEEYAAAVVPAAEPMAAPVPETAEIEKRSRQATQVSKGPSRKTAVTGNELKVILSGQVSGVVLSAEDMQPLPGACVVLKDSETGVATGFDGRFSLPAMESESTTLVASFIGMETQEIAVEEGSDVELVLQPDVLALNEVVMVAHPKRNRAAGVSAKPVAFEAEDEYDNQVNFAEPVIGFKAYKTYIEESLRFPESDTTINKSPVVLKFRITPSGEILDIVPLRSPGPEFTEEAIRLVKEGPEWNPASNASGTFEESVRLRIVFKR